MSSGKLTLAGVRLGGGGSEEVHSSPFSMLHLSFLKQLGISTSIGTVGDSHDHAMAESAMGIFKTELHRNPAVLASNGGH